MKPQALYRMFNADGDLLYVGVSVDPGMRFRSHRADKPWWSEIAQITLEHHPDRASVLLAEREAIRTERPQFNIVHNGARDGAIRLASLLPRIGDRATHFESQCAQCFGMTRPTELEPDGVGWFAVYECCDELWTMSIEVA